LRNNIATTGTETVSFDSPRGHTGNTKDVSTYVLTSFVLASKEFYLRPVVKPERCRKTSEAGEKWDETHLARPCLLALERKRKSNDKVYRIRRIREHLVDLERSEQIYLVIRDRFLSPALFPLDRREQPHGT